MKCTLCRVNEATQYAEAEAGIEWGGMPICDECARGWKGDVHPLASRYSPSQLAARRRKMVNRLAVGQNIYLICGPYIALGKVVEVTPSGAAVLIVGGGGNGIHNEEVSHFDNNGKGLDAFIYEGDAPWELDEMPFPERTAELLRTWVKEDALLAQKGLPLPPPSDFAQKVMHAAGL